MAWKKVWNPVTFSYEKEWENDSLVIFPVKPAPVQSYYHAPDSEIDPSLIRLALRTEKSIALKGSAINALGQVAMEQASKVGEAMVARALAGDRNIEGDFEADYSYDIGCCGSSNMRISGRMSVRSRK